MIESSSWITSNLILDFMLLLLLLFVINMRLPDRFIIYVASLLSTWPRLCTLYTFLTYVFCIIIIVFVVDYYYYYYRWYHWNTSKGGLLFKFPHLVCIVPVSLDNSTFKKPRKNRYILWSFIIFPLGGRHWAMLK